VPQRSELKAVFLHQVEVGQRFYCYPADRCTWIRLSPVDVQLSPVDNVPVQRNGVQVYMGGMFQVWVHAG
jgi:hypothetical protein